MSIIGRTRSWVRVVVLRGRAEREMHAEMSAHIEQAAERFRARGMSEPDALHAARREFGAMTPLQDAARESRGGQWVDNFTTDVKYALRYFARTPLTTLTIVLTLLLGVGINAGAYSLINAIMFQPPPGVPDNARLMRVRGLERSLYLDERQLSFPEVALLASQPEFASVAAWHRSPVMIDLGDGDAGVLGAEASYVTPNFFETLGVHLVAGPGFVQSRFDDVGQPELTVVLSERLAIEQFGTATAAIGKRLNVNEVILTVVGVAPPRFNGATGSNQLRVMWLPLSALPIVEHTTNAYLSSVDSAYFQAAVVMTSAASPLPLAARLSTASMAMARSSQAPSTTVATAPTYERKNVGVDIVRLRGMTEVRDERGNTKAVLTFGVLALFDLIIVLVCTTTVSSLLVGSAVTRRHEIGVRLAMGASRWRIIRQLLTESAILALVGGVGGLVVFDIICRVFSTHMLAATVAPTWSTAVFTALFAVFTALLCGLSPALHATRDGLSDVLKDSSNGATSRSRLQRTFVIAQIALAQPLLVCLGMFTAVAIRQFNPTPETALEDRLVNATFSLRAAKRFSGVSVSIEEIVARLRAMPEIVSAIPRSNFQGVYSRIVPLKVGSNTDAEGTRQFRLKTLQVSADYFNTVDLPIIGGRAFIAQDDTSEYTPIIVRSDFGRVAFGVDNPIGRALCQSPCNKGDRFVVVGVVAADRAGPTDNGRELQVFLPLTGGTTESILIRTRGPAEPLLPAIRALAHSVAPTTPLVGMATVAQGNRKSREAFLQISSATAAAGLVTLLLGCVGLYAVVALAVGQRRKEIGIRIALGAHPKQVIRLFFRGGLRLSVIGLCIGLPLSAAAVRVLATQVGVASTNMVLISSSIAAIVVGIAAIATWMPARRAAGVDAMVALRTE